MTSTNSTQQCSSLSPSYLCHVTFVPFRLSHPFLSLPALVGIFQSRMASLKKCGANRLKQRENMANSFPIFPHT
jgi:hypothetical protein